VPQVDSTAAERTRRYGARKRSESRALPPVRNGAKTLPPVLGWAAAKVPDIALPMVQPSMTATPPSVTPSSVTVPIARNIPRIAGSILLGGVAVAIAGCGLCINAWYGATLGRTSEASTMLAGLSITADILALVLPSTATILWREARHTMAFAAWSLWVVTVTITLMASVGFASVNVADTVAARGKVADENAGLAALAGRLASERATISEHRPVASLEAALQTAQGGAEAVWRQTRGCNDVTTSRSAQVCAEVLNLRQALGIAQRRDLLDVQLRDTQNKLARLPAIVAADPQADATANLFAWATAGAVNPAPVDVHMARIAGMTLMPQLAGLVLLLAVAIGQPAGTRSTRNRAGCSSAA
jgi:hypothetical protein